jgi:hypothetical protein
MYFSYDHLRFRHDPFPIGLAKPLMEPSLYREFIAQYPPLELFDFLPRLGKKYSLSEKNKPANYHAYIRGNPVWREFHRWIKSEAFVAETLKALRAVDLDLDYRGRVTVRKRLRQAARNLREGRFDWGPGDLSGRFEFSMLPADGGSVLPHSDSPGKIVTMVVSVVGDDEWNPAFGGGTDVNRHKSAEKNFNFANRRGDFADMDVIDTFEFTPNQAVIFIKTFNSWHSVRPMTGAGSTAMRRTLTIVIERET